MSTGAISSGWIYRKIYTFAKVLTIRSVAYFLQQPGHDL